MRADNTYASLGAKRGVAVLLFYTAHCKCMFNDTPTTIHMQSLFYCTKL